MTVWCISQTTEQIFIHHLPKPPKNLPLMEAGAVWKVWILLADQFLLEDQCFEFDFCSYQHELMLFSLQDVFEFWWTLNQHHLESIPGALFLKFLPKMQLDKGLFFNCSHVRMSASASGTATFALTMSCAFDYSGSILSICCFWYFSSLTTSIFLVNLKISIGVDYCFFYMVMDNRRFDFC